MRAALGAVEAGRDEEVMAALKHLPRSSPFADWKYFVRGLIAYYHQDGEALEANWGRLDSARFSHALPLV